MRVLHRRSQLEREKKVYALQARLLNPHFFELHVLASAGTYIKEFVHGDLGRTVPNVGQILGTESDILQLDVTNVFEDGLNKLDQRWEGVYQVSQQKQEQEQSK